ncbi:Protein of unknown function [Limimonas halophila]|uniref:DUF1499 domain-containing protein n=1 Tax=Limimonas halophila TaxID=1082479 RepID=A0A1G7PQW3_9PROT|nr:DUF1499 domain-containing protein [Limimonas halophila]SDF88618.1 Protein of unknown function [Limimonas halophila]
MRGIVRTLVGAGLALAVVAALAGVLAGLGTKLGFWDFRTGFAVLRWSVYGALAAVALSGAGLLGAMHQRSARLGLTALPGLVIALAAAAVPLLHVRMVEAYPPIHDITTDTKNPPRFVALAEIREEAPNAVAYPGETTAKQQKQAYPNIRPLTVPVSPERAFDAARAAAAAMGWNIAAADAEARRIEATAETFWFGFRDDVAVRVTAREDGGSRIDVRSASRVGVSDLGANAKRIREFLAGVQERLPGAAPAE